MAKKDFSPQDFEKKWIEQWEKEGIYATSNSSLVTSNSKQYILDMFPYPSGVGLHVGHARAYTGTDVLTRFYRMKGHAVLHPMGWDAFGLPAENAAIKAKKNPMEMVPGNIANFKTQMQSLGLSFDWDKEFSTTDPTYYQWTQWLFIQFFKMGLLHKKETPIYYCPFCKTGLAQEEVLADGKHERCGNMVEERTLPQWIFRITKYADRLLSDLDGLDWPQGVLEMQRNWIGRKKSRKGEVSYHLRDWIFSRQRYWGEPIPMIFCATCAKNKVTYWNTETLEIKNSKLEIGESHRDKISNKCVNISKWVEEVEKDLYGWFPVPEEALPVELPKVSSYEPSETGESPLVNIAEFVNTACPNCHGNAKRETDTMPNWAGSCWYFLYFASSSHVISSEAKFDLAKSRDLKEISRRQTPRNDNKIGPTNIENWSAIWRMKIENSANQWLPVDWYFGGTEHAVLHLLYSRFWIKAMYDLGLVDMQEPFTRLRNVGMVIAEDHRKMSKSLGNVINPNDVVDKYGADTTRTYEMFMAPFSQEVVWSTQNIQGAHRFIRRIWQIYNSSDYLTKQENEEDYELVAELQSLINRVTTDITDVKFNTAISAMMEFLNLWEKLSDGHSGTKRSEVTRFVQAPARRVESPQILSSPVGSSRMTNRKLSIHNAKSFLKLLAPFAPFIAEEIWRNILGETESIHISSWPEASSNVSEKKEVTIPIQVNGKVRDIITISSQDLSEETVVKKALESEKINKWLENNKYEVVYKEGKILNLVFK